MKFLSAFLLTALLSFIAGLYLPWWSIAIVAFLVALLIPQTIGRSFLSGFLGIFILWMIIAAIIDIRNEHILSHKIAQIFPVGGSAMALLFVTGLIGGIVGGMAAISGSAVWPKRKVAYRRA